MNSNDQHVSRGFQMLAKALAPFIVKELEAKFGGDWWHQGVVIPLSKQQKQQLPTKGGKEELTNTLDSAGCLLLIETHWIEIFGHRLSSEHRVWIRTLTIALASREGETRIDSEEAGELLDTMARVTEQIDAKVTEKLREHIRALRYGTSGSSVSKIQTPRGDNLTCAEGTKEVTRERSSARLPSWRELMQPHPDVAAGRYQNAEFAADLAQVARGTAQIEYQDPVEFFARSYITGGVRGLLLQGLKRLSGKGGEPVIQLKTAFGGGKTHSLLALYHLFRGHAPIARMDQIRVLLDESRLDIPRARVAVLVGTELDPNQGRLSPITNTTVNTLWGEIGAQFAEQTGEQELYDFVRAADQSAVPPGSGTMRDMLDACGPCLILVDELVAYARKLYDKRCLPSGTFDAVLSFIQELTEAVRATKTSLLVATIPESDLEVGGHAGQEALKRIEHTFGRLEAIWKPVGTEEGFEVVRRRLFLPLSDTSARDGVCRAFSEVYQANAKEFPSECSDHQYLERMKACYPVHPEVFDRLYKDWATLENFQRTRGVLRLMAAVIHDLWIRNDTSLMILPGSICLGTASVREELARYLPEGWRPVLESDVDGKGSVPLQVDKENPRFGQYMAACKVGRSVFLGSAPHVVQQQVRGLEDLRIRLAVVQPREQVSVYNDVLSQLSGRLTYLYRKDRRYWYDTRPNLRRTVEDRAQRIPPDQIEREVVQLIRAMSRGNFDAFCGLHVCPESTGEVPDEKRVRLVILRPNETHVDNESNSGAQDRANEILMKRNGHERMSRNMLVFLAPDRDAMVELGRAIQRYLAWTSVVKDRDMLNLDTFQRREADEGMKDSKQALNSRLVDTYRWLLVPSHRVTTNIEDDNSKDPNRSDPDDEKERGEFTPEWEIARVTEADTALIDQCSKALIRREQVIVKWSPALLEMELNNWFWEDKKHVHVKEIWDALTSYYYFPRLRDPEVFIQTIREGVKSGSYFGYASSVASDGRYVDLLLGEWAPNIRVDAASVLVKPAVAKLQIDQEPPSGEPPLPPRSEPRPGPVHPELPHRFFGVADLDAVRAGRDMGQIAEEVLQHLTTLENCEVTVTVEIHAHAPKGIPSDVQAILTENCKTLRFKIFRFEKS